MTSTSTLGPGAYYMRVHCLEKQARDISDFLAEMLDPADTAVSTYEAAATTQHWNSVLWAMEVFFGQPPDQKQLREMVTQAAGPELAAEAEFGRVDERDWVENSLAGLVAVRAGRFVVHGAHSRGEIKSNDIGLEIEAALAFGTGHHGTTRGCLLMLDKILKQRRPQRILDIGTGTGVLAIAAARALKRRVAAGDIDAVSVAAARGNAKLNATAPYVMPVKATGLRHPAMRGKRFYDLAFANILARPLRLMAVDLASAVADRGQIVLSGLLVSDVNGVRSAYALQGFHLVQTIQLEGWVTLLMQR